MEGFDTSAIYRERRQELLQYIDDDAIGILYAAPELIRNGDSAYPYRQNSDFYYFTGFEEPNAIAVFIPKREAGEFILFNQPHDPVMEVWNGPRAGQEGATEKFGADESFPIDTFKEKFLELLKGRETIFFPIGRDKQLDEIIVSQSQLLKPKVRRSPSLPCALKSIEPITNDMRLIKSAFEISLLRQAAKITTTAHRQAMLHCKPGMMEYELESLLLHEFCRHGARKSAYESIVGGGANSCILHYSKNNNVLQEGDLVLVDAGAEYGYYASDVTRTYPVNGKFTKEQQAIYEIVLEAQRAAIKQMLVGMPWVSMQREIVKVITQGLIDLEILKGNLETLIKEKAYERFYMHNPAHWMGLDVHDVGPYETVDGWILFKAGMVSTIEPGIYIQENAKDVDPKWWNIGVRIEDDVLITEDACEVLTSDLPKTVSEIESLMQEGLK